MINVPFNKEGYKLLLSGMKALSDVQSNGVRIDTEYCKRQYQELTNRIKEQEEKLYKHKEIKEWKKKYKRKFNLNSGPQLADILFNEFGYKPKKLTEKEKPSTDAEALKGLQVPFTEDLILLRQLGKIKNTYIKGLLQETVNGYLHPFLDLHTTITFRSSSRQPNAQNIPVRDPYMGKIIRSAFIPRKNHYFVESDYGGMEVKGAAIYHQDPTMLKYLRNFEKSDMHADFFKLCFKMSKYDSKCKGDKFLRKATKNCWTFPQFYGDYYGNNAKAFWQWIEFNGGKIHSSDGIKEIILSNGNHISDHMINVGLGTFKLFENHLASIEDTMWKKRFPVYAKWRKDQYKKYLRDGYITSLSGFSFQGILKKNEVVNYPIQALAFHCLLWSLIRLNKLLKKYKMKTKITFQIHDSIVSDVYKKERKTYYEMMEQVMIYDLKKHWKFINIPLEIEIGSSALNGNWHDSKTDAVYIA